MFFVLAGVFMGVQLSWMAPNWWSIALRMSVGSGCYRHGGGLFLPAFATGFPERVKSVSGPKFILPAIDGSTVKKSCFSWRCWCLRWRGRLWFQWDGGYRHPDHDLHYSRSRADVVVGLSGLLVLGYGGFYAIALTLLRCSITITVWASGPVCDCRVNGSGGGLPARLPGVALRGDYLAIVTLGFGEIVRILCSITPKLPADRTVSVRSRNRALRTRVQPYRP